MSLLNCLRPFIQRPLSALGEAAVSAYEGLPGVAGWTPPPNIQPVMVHRVLEIGWPFAVLGVNTSLDRIKRKFVSGKIEGADLSVIHAGALLTKLGGSVEFLKEEKDYRTADIRARWGPELTDVEVTTPLTKDRQTELQSVINTLSQVIGMDGNSWHPLIHLGDVPVETVQSRIIEAIIDLKPDERTGDPNIWDVYAVPFEQGESLVDRNELQKLRPSWWADDGPSCLQRELQFRLAPLVG